MGAALVALQHEELKELGITSVGHRLTILKSVYEVKIRQDVLIESDHYVPLCKSRKFNGRAITDNRAAADAEAQYATATLKDIRHLVDQLRIRDERMTIAEREMQRITEEYRKLREELLPVFRRIKESEQPLPYPAGHTASAHNQGYGHDAPSTISPAAPTPSLSQSGLQRKFSTKQLYLGSTPKNVSPTYHQPTIPERSIMENTLDPASAVDRTILSSAYLPGVPSPTSPHTNGTLTGSTLASRSYRSDLNTPSTRSFPQSEDPYAAYKPGRDSMLGSSSRRAATASPLPPGPIIGANGSVEVHKSFRVSLEDPCYKVLPAALKKYNIDAPADQYALYIVYGNEQRCLQRDEKPLILFKQLDKEGKKPMFMLRKSSPGGDDMDGGGLYPRGMTPLPRGYDNAGGII